MSVILAQDTPSEELRETASNVALSPLETEAIGLFVQLGRMLSQPKSFAEVYGILFVSPRPMPIEGLVKRLGPSKPAIHRALRFLRKAGLLRMVYVPGDRRAHYEAVAELRHIVTGVVRDRIVPQLANAENRIHRLAKGVGKLPKDQRSQLSGRVAILQRWSRQSGKLASAFLGLLRNQA